MSGVLAVERSYPAQSQTSAKTISDLFDPIETWDEKEPKSVGRSLRKHVEKVIRVAKDTPFEQELTKRLAILFDSERAQEVTFWTKQGGMIVYRRRSDPVHNRQSFR